MFKADPDRPLVVVGAANMDVVGLASTGRVPGDSTPGRLVLSPGGVARNVAHVLAQLGTAVDLVSVVGDDVFGGQVISRTLAAGVNTQAIHVVAGGTTSSYLALLEPDGSLAWAVNDMQILESLTPQRLAQEQQRLQNAAGWVLDCNLTDSTLAWLFGQARSCPVAVDGVSAAKVGRVAPWLGQIDLLKINRLEAAALTGLALDSVGQALLAAEALRAKGVAQVLITLGAWGAGWCDTQGRTGYLPVAPGPASGLAGTNNNNNGAGDALFAGLLAALGRGANFETAMACAMVCAAHARAGLDIDRATISP